MEIIERRSRTILTKTMNVKYLVPREPMLGDPDLSRTF